MGANKSARNYGRLDIAKTSHETTLPYVPPGKRNLLFSGYCRQQTQLTEQFQEELNRGQREMKRILEFTEKEHGRLETAVCKSNIKIPLHLVALVKKSFQQQRKAAFNRVKVGKLGKYFPPSEL